MRRARGGVIDPLGGKPGAEHQEGAGDALELPEMMGDEHEGEPHGALKLREEIQDPGCDLGIEHRGGFVREDQIRPTGDRPGDRDALAFSTGESPGERILPGHFNPHVPQEYTGCVEGVTEPRPQAQGERFGHGAPRGPSGVQGVHRGLEDRPDPAPGRTETGSPDPADVDGPEENPTAGDRRKPQERPHQDALARPALPHHGEGAPGGNLQVQPPQHGGRRSRVPHLQIPDPDVHPAAVAHRARPCTIIAS